MSKSKGFSIHECQIVASKIKTQIFEPALTFKTSIFLCGRDIHDKSSIRYKIAKLLTERFWYASSFDIVYPEDIFDELLYGSNSPDLLSLENLLADSVDAVVVIPESAGSFAELGAFANNEKLRSKMICVLDEQYKRDKSFINQGPVKLIKNTNRDAIVYIDVAKLDETLTSRIEPFDRVSVSHELDKLVSVLRRMKRKSVKFEDNISLLQLDRFLLPTIYLLQPVAKEVLSMIVSLAMNDEVNGHPATTTALAMLTKKRFIEATANGFILTSIGKKEFFSFRENNTRGKQLEKTVAIDSLRLEILNFQYRNKKLKA